MASRSIRVTEKEISTAGVISEEPLEANEAAEVIPERSLRRAIWTIVYGVGLPCIPIIVISAVLLYIIFRYRLKLNPSLPALQGSQSDATKHNLTTLVSEFGNFQKRGGEWAYYVRYNPSTITTIASWTSRIVPYLQSSIMALVAFFAARHIVLKSKHGDESQLPNPEQLALLIATLGGSGFEPLKEVFLYRFTRRGRLIHPLPAAVSAFAIITTMALIIPIIDTWFGVATTAETVTQLTPNNATLTYGRGISSSACPNGPADNRTANNMLQNATAFWPCNVWTAINPSSRFVSGLAEAGNIAVGASNYTKIQNFTDSTNTTFWYMGSPSQNSAQDYQAKTFATSSQCRSMSLKQCNIMFGLGSNKFQCNDNFVGSLVISQLDPTANGTEDMSGLNVGLAFSGNAALTDVTGQVLSSTTSFHHASSTDPEMYTTNPLYYGAWAFGFPSPDPTFQGDFKGDADYYWDRNYGGLWMLNCSTTVYEVTYAWVNGAVATFNTSLATGDMAALLTGPFVVGAGPFIQNSLLTVAAIAGAANNSNGIANIFSEHYSQLLLAYSTGALEEQPVLAEQGRVIIPNIARVPLVPLYLLLATKAIYVLAVIILAIAAYAFTHPAETELVKDQLSVRGLTAAHFERPDAMQEFVVQQLQAHLDAQNGGNLAQIISSPDDIKPSRTVSERAATGPADSAAKPPEAKVGLMPTADGTWQFVLKADGVWNRVKPLVTPIIKQVVMQESQAGQLGTAGSLINAYHGK